MIGRYLLFVFPEYYAAGGWNDLRGDFHTEKEAMTTMAGIFDEGASVTEAYHAQIVDRVNGNWIGFKLNSANGKYDNQIIRQDGLLLYERSDNMEPFVRI